VTRDVVAATPLPRAEWLCSPLFSQPRTHLRSTSSSNRAEHTRNRINTYASLDAQIAAIETKIVRLHAQACLLRQRRNALTPFGRLPVEIFHYILDLFMQSTLLPHYLGLSWYRTDHETWYKRGERIGWVSIMGVCTFLRNIATSYPALWSHIDFSRCIDWTVVCLQRSRDHPLRITWSEPTYAWKDYLLQHAMERACDVRIYTFSELDENFMPSLLNGAHPRLCSLTYAPKIADVLELPAHFLGTDTTTITRLVLEHVEFHYDEIQLPFLEYFECRRICHARPHQIFSLIRGAPRLSHLRLDDNKGAVGPYNPHMPSINLPRLVHVEITTKLECIASYMAVLPVPRETYTISVCKDSVEPRFNGNDIAVRQYVIEFVYRIVASEDAYNPPAVRLSRDTNTSSSVQWQLEIVRSEEAPDIQYTDYSDQFERFHPILRRAQSILVDGRALQVFTCALKYPAELLEAVEDIVLLSVSIGTHDLKDLHVWITRRAKSHRPLRSMEFRQCQRTDSEDFQNWIAFLMQNNLVTNVGAENYDGETD
jgi:hypothetical protein